MKKFCAATLLLAGVTTLAVGQPGVIKIHTRPALPATEALERMSLKLQWSARLLLRGDRDGLASVQVIPGPDHHPQLLVETYSGLVALYDAETGDRLWENQVGKAYSPGQPPTANTHSVFISRRNILYVLNRHTGLNRLFTVDKFTGVRTNGIDLPYMPSAMPVADDIFLYFVMDTRAVVFRLPVYGAQGEALRYKIGGEEVPVLPEPGLFYPVSQEYLQLPPLVAGKQFTVVSAEGTLTALSRFEQHTLDEYSLNSKVVAMPGQYNAMAYVGTEGGTLHAINMESSQQRWRFLPGGAIHRQPAVLDRDVFVSADKVGMFRLDRDSGRELWHARQADRFLAANDKFVYVIDTRGEFRVLDSRRGSTLALFDAKDWTVSVINELTDRIYLGAHDGQIVCLRHRDLPEPVRYRQPPPAPKEEKKEPRKMEEPKDEKGEDKNQARQFEPVRPAFLAALPTLNSWPSWPQDRRLDRP